MRFLWLFLLVSFVNHQDNSVDILIRNGKVLDGTGNSWFYADIAIKDGLIVKIGKLPALKAVEEIDAKGMIVAPGFIDVHTHIEGDEMQNPAASNFIIRWSNNCCNRQLRISSKVDLKTYFNMLDSLRFSRKCCLTYWP